MRDLSRRISGCLVILPFLAFFPAMVALAGEGVVDEKVWRHLETHERVPVSILLRPPEGGTSLSPEGRKATVADLQARVLERLAGTGFHLRFRYVLLFGLAGEADRAAIEALSGMSEVSRVYFDETLVPLLAQGVPLIRGDEMHAMGFTGTGQTVAVIDTGIDYTHPDLGGCFGEGCKVVGGYDFANDDPDPKDEPGTAGHGTAVAGIIASTNVPNQGVAPDARLVALKVCDTRGCASSAIDAALDWVLLNHEAFGITVVNMSLGTSEVYQDPEAFPCSFSVTAQAVADLAQAGVVTVAASGNCGRGDGISSPACIPEAISVGAVYDATFGQIRWNGEGTCQDCTDPSPRPDVVNCYTNSAPILDLMAPSYSATTTRSNGGAFTGFAGTSAAAPYAAGAVALLRQAAGDTVTPEDIRHALKVSGVGVTDPKNGLTFPRIDLPAALAALPKRCGGVPLEPVDAGTVPPGAATGNFEAIIVGEEHPDPGEGHLVVHLGGTDDLNGTSATAAEFEREPGIPVYQILLGNPTPDGDLLLLQAQKSVNGEVVIDLENPESTPLNLGKTHAFAAWYPGGTFFTTPEAPAAVSIGGSVLFCETAEGVGGGVSGRFTALFPIANYPEIDPAEVSPFRLRANFESVIATPEEDGPNLGDGNGVANLDGTLIDVNGATATATLGDEGRITVTLRNPSEEGGVFELSLPAGSLVAGGSVPIDPEVIRLRVWGRAADFEAGVPADAHGVSGIVTAASEGAGQESGARIAAEIRATVTFETEGSATSEESALSTAASMTSTGGSTGGSTGTSLSTEAETGGRSGEMSDGTHSGEATTGGLSDVSTGGATVDTTEATSAPTTAVSSASSSGSTGGTSGEAPTTAVSSARSSGSTGGTSGEALTTAASSARTSVMPSSDVAPTPEWTASAETTGGSPSETPQETASSPGAPATGENASGGGCGGCATTAAAPPADPSLPLLALFLLLARRRRRNGG